MNLSDAKKYRITLVLGTTFLLAFLLYNAKLTIDALITFRVVDNFVHGYGLRWNVHERVQAYTNPLWMLLHIPFYALWQNIVAVTLLLSLSCILIFCLITAYTFPRHWIKLVALFFIPLAISPTFTFYAVSGLEGPLTLVLFAAFGWALLRAPQQMRWFYISFFISLSLVNRLDEVIFYLPISLYLLISRYRDIHWRQCWLGSLPIIGWLSFSLFYYGFIFPNTKYAKLNTGISEQDYINHGLLYLENLLATDFFSAMALLAVVVGVPLYALLAAKKDSLPPEMLCIALGITYYSCYIIYVGGDYLAWHYWLFPVFASLWWIYAVPARYLSSQISIVLAVWMLAYRMIYPHYGVIIDGPWRFGASMQQESGWTLYVRKYFLKAESPWPQINRHEMPGFTSAAVIPVFAWEHGPSMNVVDILGLADPLLARLPATPGGIAIVGHYMRDIPQGYFDAINTGSLDKMDPDLAQYYAKLRLIESGNVWDIERLKEIVLFNLGRYDYLRDRYIMTHHLSPL